MSLSKTDAKELIELGFKRQDFEDKIYPSDIYEYDGAVWVVGGRLLPNGNLICDDVIYNEGTWIPTAEDLIAWLDNNDCKFILEYNGGGYKIEANDSKGKVSKAKGGTIEYTLFKAIIKILKEYGGNPVQKTWKVIEAELA
jgi:hypothetical protein